MKVEGWRSVYREIRKKFLSRGRARIDRKLSEEVTMKLDLMKKLFVREVVGDELKIAYEWSAELKKSLTVLKESLGAAGVIFPRELGSFLEDPEAHLRKKLFIYAMDLARGKLTIRSFEEKSRRAIQTSLQTNLRGVYPSWVFLTILSYAASEGGYLLYPEHGYLSLERSGRQKLSSIPPNAAIETSKGALSFFLEVPRPIAWEDMEDLRKVWKLYKAMRPEILVYGGKIMDYSKKI